MSLGRAAAPVSSSAADEQAVGGDSYSTSSTVGACQWTEQMGAPVQDVWSATLRGLYTHVRPDLPCDAQGFASAPVALNRSDLTLDRAAAPSRVNGLGGPCCLQAVTFVVLEQAPDS